MSRTPFQNRVQRRAALTAGPTLAALTLALTLGAAGAAGAEDSRTLSVTGSGSVRAEPDIARISIGVLAKASTVDAARNQANQVVERLQAVTRRLNIAPAQVQSTHVLVRPEYTWSPAKKLRELSGYSVSRELNVELKNLDQLGNLIEQSISAGADVVQDPVLDSSHRHDLEREALSEAMQDARRNAEVLARGADASLGAARNVSSQINSFRPRPQPMASMAMAGAAPAMEAPQTYQSGELSFDAGVNVVYDLVPNRRP